MNNEEKNVSVNPGKIYAAIAGVIEDVGFVAKDKINKQQGFKYRSVDDVFNALHPALAKNKVFIVPRILERNCATIGKTQKGTDMIKVVCKIKFTFFAEDGSSVESVIVGEGLDTGDKATNKAMATAYKYACFQVFCIPTEELMNDPDSESQELEEGNRQKSKKEKEKPAEKKSEETKKPEAPKQSGTDTSEDSKITEAMLNTIRAEQKRTGVTDKLILGVKTISAKDIESLTVREFKIAMSKLEKTPDLVRGDGKNE